MRKGIAVYGVSAVVLAAVVWAHDDSMKMPMNSAEFNQVKQLVGNWKSTGVKGGDMKMPGPLLTQFKLTAGGSAIEETLFAGSPHEMVDMYSDESGKLTMVHYCAMGNQPHMVVRKSDAKTIALETTSVPGLNVAKDAHMHALTLSMPEPNKLIETWSSMNVPTDHPGETVIEFVRAK